ncbi:hypothetical protein QM012_003708 [Aureobasidium pullulans]|uniref:Uncharacterized protein n=1 Tax=Aureobasidium pullulans TaxID=5580 RepID=A0ABR0T821_AURPU
MANNFMLNLLVIFFGCLPFRDALAQVSKKPDLASSAVQHGKYHASTLVTSFISKPDIVLHEANTLEGQPELGAIDDNPAEMDNDEVLSDAEEDDDHDDSLENELIDASTTDSGDAVMSSASKGKRLKARLIRYHKADCEKKRRPHKGKKMKEGKCHTLHKNHFNSYEFTIGKKKKDKKDKDDDDDDDSKGDTSKGCRMIIFFDGKCKDEASTTNAEDSCKDIGEEGVDDDDKKLQVRDLMGKKGKGPKYKSAKFICDGVDSSDKPTTTEIEEDYYVTTTVYSQPVRVADSTGSSSKSYTPSSVTAIQLTRSATRVPSKSGEPTSTTAPVEEKDPDNDDDYKEGENEDDEKEDDDEDKEISTIASASTKTKSHKSKKHTKSNKHHTKTQAVVTTESVQTTGDSPDI